MKPYINHSTFGSIIIDEHSYNHDVLIRSDGHIEKRNKKLSKKMYGTSHTISLDEAEFIYEDGVHRIIIGCGQQGALGMSEEAKKLFRQNQIDLILADTPHAEREYNSSKETCVGLFHVTC